MSWPLNPLMEMALLACPGAQVAFTHSFPFGPSTDTDTTTLRRFVSHVTCEKGVPSDPVRCEHVKPYEPERLQA